MVLCLEQGADLHLAQLLPLPPTVSCFSKIHIAFIFLVPAHPGSHGQRATKWGCVCLLVFIIKVLVEMVFSESTTEIFCIMLPLPVFVNYPGQHL